MGVRFIEQSAADGEFLRTEKYKNLFDKSLDGGFFPGAFGGLLDFSGSQVAGADFHALDGAIFDDLDGLKIGEKTADGDARGFQPDTAGFLGNTAGGDAFAHTGLFAGKITDSGHSFSLKFKRVI